MKLIIAGSRSLKDRKQVFEVLDKSGVKPSEVVSGCAGGVDVLGAQWAYKNAIPVKKMPADWNELGKCAGFIRNAEMAEYADELLAIWDGRSRGTKHMIDVMSGLGKPVTVVHV